MEEIEHTAVGPEESTENLDEYEYTALQPNEIRLVTIHPGSGPDELKCTIITEDLDLEGVSHNYRYEALSYTWGDPVRRIPIKCNTGTIKLSWNEEGDQSEVSAKRGELRYYFPLWFSHHVRITRNLEVAMRRLREKDDYRLVWIDSICINQDDIQERNAQVKIMHRIYMHAKKVLVWLGESQGASYLAVNCIERLLDLKQLHAPAPDKVDEMDSSIGFRPWILSKDDPRHLKSEYWEEFKAMLTSSWFSRTWVIQEVAYARHAVVLYGYSCFDWDDLESACETIASLKMYAQAFGRTNFHFSAILLATVRQAFKEIMRRMDASLPQVCVPAIVLDELLVRTWSLESTDPRDKVFALLSIAIRDRNIIRDPGYSLSVREVYLNAARHCFEAGGEESLEMLCYARARKTIAELPSWVPDWSSGYGCTTILNPDGFRAAGGTQVCASFPRTEEDIALGRLIARGARVLTIETIADTNSCDVHCEMLNRFAASPYPTTNLPYIDLYSKVINPVHLSGHHLKCKRTRTFWDHIQSFSTLCASQDWQPYTKDELAKQLPVWITVPHFVSGLGLSAGRRFFITTTGFMGLALDDSVAGDEICIFMGLGTPFVIRKEEGEESVYKLIGQCSVMGIMEGEVMEGIPESSIEDIELR